MIRAVTKGLAARSLTKRSYHMSCVRSKNTTPELKIRRLVHGRGLRYRIHVDRLSGRPDLAFIRAKVAVFIDGDFWHGWRFPRWREKMGDYWRAKIDRNRRRDTENFRKLRSQGWLVIRIWEHEIKRDARGCVDRVEAAVRKRFVDVRCRVQ
jgi:DNA mismatch endonuclease, patch repair protein